jgi:hypothetical protein
MGAKSGIAGLRDLRSKLRLGLVGLVVMALGTLAVTTIASALPLPTDQLIFTAGPPASAQATGTGVFSVTIELQNPVGPSAQTGLTDTIDLAITPGTGAPGAVLTCTGGLAHAVSSSTGLVTFSGCAITLASPIAPVVNNYTLTATDPAPSATLAGVNPGTSTGVAITAGTVTQLAYTTQPASGANIGVLSKFSIAVAEEDRNGNINLTSSLPVSLILYTNPGAATLSGPCSSSLAPSSGVSTFTGCAINATGNGYVIQASIAGPITAFSNSFNIVPTVEAMLAFQTGYFSPTPPTTAVAGATIGTAPLHVLVEDSGGGLVTTDNSTQVTLSLGNNPGGGTLTCTGTGVVNNEVTASAGIATFSTGCTINKVGSGYTIVATDSTNGGVNQATSTPVNITVSTATQLAFTEQPAANASITYGSPFAVQVAVEDGFGNVVTTDSVTNITLTLFGTGSPTLTCTPGVSNTTGDLAGFATFSCQINALGPSADDYLTATSSPPYTSATSNTFNSSPTIGAPAKLVIVTQPGSPVAAGAPFGVLVELEDAFGNVETSDTSSQITLAIGANPTGGTLTCPGGTTEPLGNFAPGETLFTGCSVNLAGSPYTLTFTDSTDVGVTPATSNDFTVTANTANHLVFITQPLPNGSVGVSSPFTVQAAVEDADGNIVTSLASTLVTLALTTGPGTLACPSADTANTVAGVATFSPCTINTAHIGDQLTASIVSPAISVLSNLFNVAPIGPAAKLAFTVQPVNLVAGNTMTVAVSVEDTSGNLETSDNGRAIGLTSSGGTFSCTGTPAVDTNGVVTYTGCSSHIAGTYTLQATAAGLTTATSNPFTVYPGPANHLAFVTQPGNGAVSSPLAPQPVVAVEDVYGNVLNSGPNVDNGRSISLAIGANPGSGALTCTSTATVLDVNGEAVFSGCAISAAGVGYTLNASTSLLATVGSAAFNVGGIQLVFTTEPGNAPAPSALLFPQPVVSVENGSGVVTSGADSTDLITLTIGANPGSGILTCPAVAAVAGVATFAGCSINASGTGYTLHATDTSNGAVASTTSTAFNVGATPPVVTIAGIDAIGTSIATSLSEFPAAGSASAVVLARSDAFTDALAADPLAAHVNGPLLITPGASLSTSLDPRVQAEIQRVLPVGRTVYIIGGPIALSTNIDSTLQGLGYVTQRISGVNLYATAVAIAQFLGNPLTIFEATGLNFQDALSAVPAAIATGGAILLTNGAVQAPETAAYLAANPGDIRYAIGGILAAFGADPTANEVAGVDLYGTSAAVASLFFPTAHVFGVATGLNFPDALSGGLFMATGGRLGPMLLVGQTTPLPPAIAAYLATLEVGAQGYIFGGLLAIPAVVVAAIQAAIA